MKNQIKRINRFTGAFCLMLMVGCASLTPKDSATSETSDDADNKPAEKVKETIIFGDFSQDDDTLYDLIVAEVAAQRSQFGVTLLNYIQQARITRDIGVIKRAINIAQYNKDIEAIIELAQLWRETEPESIQAHQLLAFQHTLLKDYEIAVDYMEQILDLGGNARVESLAVGAKSVPQQEKEQILALYQELYSRHNQNDEVGYSVALLQRINKQQEPALNTINEVLSRSPDFQPAVLLKSNILYDLGKIEEALAFTKERYKAFPANHNLGRIYASMLIEKKDYEAAQEVFEELIEIYPQVPTLRLSRALVMIEAEKLEEAAVELEKLDADGVHINEANFYLGRIADKNEDKEEAIKRYQKVKGGLHFTTSLERASYLLTQLDRTEEALANLQKLREERPNAARQLWMLEIRLLNTLKETDLTLTSLNKAIEQFPEDEELIYSRAMLYESNDQLDLMEKDLRHLIENNAQHAIAMNALGYTLADRTDRLQEALGLITVALSLKPDNPAILDSMGWVLFKVGKTAEALPFLLRAFQSYPDGEVAAHLGEVLWELNQATEAKEVWLKALETQPEHETLLETINRLNPDLLKEVPEPAAADATEG